MLVGSKLVTAALVACVGVGGCAAERQGLSAGEERGDPSVLIEAPSQGTITVERNGNTQSLTRWSGEFTITEEEGGLDSLRIGMSARADSSEDPDSLGVSIFMTAQLERGPFSLVGSYDIAYRRAPQYSGTVTLRLDGVELRDPSDATGESSGTLVIREHEGGRVVGALNARLEDGSDVSARLEGEVSARCLVLATGAEAEETDTVSAPFDHPFCAQYFQ